MTRAEHLAWAKERALEYVERDQPHLAIASMISDLTKHEGWDDEGCWDCREFEVVPGFSP